MWAHLAAIGCNGLNCIELQNSCLSLGHSGTSMHCLSPVKIIERTKNKRADCRIVCDRLMRLALKLIMAQFCRSKDHKIIMLSEYSNVSWNTCMEFPSINATM